MEITILDSTRIKIYRLINVSILAAVSLCIIAIVFGYFSSEALEKISGYFIVFSMLPLTVGLLSVLKLFHLNKRTAKIDPADSSCELVLNYLGDKFEQDKLKHIATGGNLLVVNSPIEKTVYEISSSQVRKLLSNHVSSTWPITYEKRKTKWFDESPKAVFNCAMWMLWGAS